MVGVCKYAKYLGYHIAYVLREIIDAELIYLLLYYRLCKVDSILYIFVDLMQSLGGTRFNNISFE